jgi:predicted porin
LEDKFSVNPTTSKSLAVDTMNSADMGVNFQTKTPYFSSELGLFDGEGYHPATNQKLSTGLSEEWRLTGHLMGNGEQVGKYKLDKDTYANISFAGIRSQNEKFDGSTDFESATYDKNMYMFHAVYSQPEFLIAAQYDVTKYEYATANSNDRKLKTWSVNGEIRPAQDWTVLARYDSVKTEYANNAANNTNNVNDGTQVIYGVAYDYNKNVKFIASGKTVNSKQSDLAGATSTDAGATVGDMIDKQSWMLTTEVNW